MRKVYISFNRSKIDTDAHGDEDFMGAVAAMLDLQGKLCIGYVKEPEDLSTAMTVCDEVLVCLRYWTDESRLGREELPGAFMCSEANMANHLGLPISTQFFIFKF